MEVTITNLVYEGVHEVEHETPLGLKVKRQIEIDSFVVTFSVGKVKDHNLYFKPEALGNRITHYDSVEEEMAAVESLVRECVFGWTDELQPEDPEDRVQLHGGIDPRITVKWAKGARKDAEQIVHPHKHRVAWAVEHFSRKDANGDHA